MWIVSLRRATLLTLLATAHAWAQVPPATEPPIPPSDASPLAYPHMELRAGPDTFFRFGIQLQAWANYLQSPTRVGGEDGGYSLDLYLRRTRLFVYAQIFKNVNAFILLGAPNLGRAVQTGTGATATVTRFPGPVVEDAFAEVKLAGDAFMIEGGLMLVPFSHNLLQLQSRSLTLDVGNTTAVIVNAGTSLARDTGFQLKGYEMHDKLEWRLFVGSGLRQPANGDNPLAHNGPRVTAHIQYQLFDADAKIYIYSAHTYGKKKLLGVSAGFDFQMGDDVGTTPTDPYLAFSAGVFGALPLAGAANPDGGDELAFTLEYYHYDGGTTFPGVALANQNDLDAEVAYYNKNLHFSVFGKLELQEYADDGNKAANKLWFGGGVKYFVAEQLCNLTLFYQRTELPDADASLVNGTNQLTLQLQVMYY